jgi:predicted molibdopterin-dependent oxidoreductase YjgC
MLTVPTVCPFCACGCGLYMLAHKGELVGVAPSQTHPVSQGRLCAKGWAAHEAPGWGERLRTPLIRNNGKTDAVSWDAALDLLVERIKGLLDAGKSMAVLGSPRVTNEENYLAGRLARAAFHTNHIDFCSHSSFRNLLAGVEEVTGEHAGFASLIEVEASETIILLEGDLARTHPRAAFSIMRAVDKGARLVTVGCAKTQMAHLSSLHLTAAPGNCGEVIDGLLAGVISLGLEDRRSVEERCEGYEALRRGVEGLKPTDELQKAAKWVARAGRATFLISPTGGSAQHSQKEAAALASLAAITGHLERTGSGLLLLLGRSNVRGACEMGVAPDRLPGYQTIKDERALSRMRAVWGKEPPDVQGLDAEAMLGEASGLIIVAEDPPSNLAMGKRALAALERMELVAVLDAFVTPTVKTAHVVLPIASFAESVGTVTNMEGRVQLLRATLDPPGEARPGWHVLADLCARFGLSAPYSSSADVFREIAQAAPRYAGIRKGSLDEGWGETLANDAERRKALVRAAGAAVMTSAEHPYLLARDGVLDWGSDPLVFFSPTLRRDYVSRQKIFPQGMVEMSRQDADELGVRAGWRVRLISIHGDAVLPVVIRTDLKRGVLFVPFAFRENAATVFGADSVTAVNVKRV